MNSKADFAIGRAGYEPTKPLNPVVVALSSFVITIFLSSIILAINWRRFARGWWGIPTALTPLLCLAIVIFGTLVIIPTLETISGNSGLGKSIGMGFIIFFGLLGISFPFFIAQRQAAALKVWDNEGYEAVSTYDYAWQSMLSRYFIILLGLALAGTIWMMFQPV